MVGVVMTRGGHAGTAGWDRGGVHACMHLGQSSSRSGPSRAYRGSDCREEERECGRLVGEFWLGADRNRRQDGQCVGGSE